MPDPFEIALLAAAGLVGGLVLLVRGMRGYLDAARISDTATSTIESIAAGEVRVTGTVEPAEALLVSPLQSRRCVWYRAEVVESRGREGSSRLLDEERAVGFRIRDASGVIRVFPRGGRFDAPEALTGGLGLLGEDPPGLEIRRGPALDLAEPDRETLVARLTTVQPAGSLDQAPGRLAQPRLGSRRYKEARIDPGDVVTIVGSAVPFGQLADPDLADTADGADVGSGDPEVLADVDAARRAGTLAASADAAWGNAAIPGFGIGAPTRAPALDPDARPEPAPAPDGNATPHPTWDISPDTLVLAAVPGVPLLVVAGAPSMAASRETDRFVLGLLGAAMSIACAVVLAVVVEGGLR